MNLKQVNEALDHKIEGGSEYNWDIYGPNVRYLDFASDNAHASVLFDTVTQEIYEATVNDNDDKFAYRWLNADTKELYIEECKKRKIDPNIAWDQKKWYDLEVDEDWLTKAKAIMRGENFDSRVIVPIDLADEELFQLMKLAHENDITLNQMVERILQQVIDEKLST